jgi:hypothetical protein
VRCGHVGCLPLRLVSSSAPACVHKHIERKRGLESFRFTVEYLGLGLARAHLRGARVLICHGGLHGKNGNSLVRTVVCTSGTRIRSLSAIATPDSEHWLQLRRATPDSDAGARRARHLASPGRPRDRHRATVQAGRASVSARPAGLHSRAGRLSPVVAQRPHRIRPLHKHGHRCSSRIVSSGRLARRYPN